MLALGLFWLGLFRQLRVDWLVHPQYSYGWGVPLLCLYLFWKRWRTRPPAAPARGRWLASAMAGLMLLGWLPVRLLQEANPDWRLLSWLGACAVVGLTLGVIGFAGGPPWLRHFFVPVAFAFVAVPWPSQLEVVVTQGLRSLATGATVEILNWFGVAAVQRGHLIELAGSVVGVEDACSGVRTAQTILVAALFCGELQRLSLGRRLALVAGGELAGLLLNIVRTGFLTWLCAEGGADLQHRWHDPAGMLALALALGGTWIFAARLARPRARPPESAPAVPPAGPVAPHTVPRLVPAAAWAVVLFWLGVTEATTAWWYQRNETAANPNLRPWTIAWPESNPGFARRQLGEETLGLLRCDTAEAGFWQREDGSEWTLFYLRWEPGRLAAHLAQGHTPDVCLPANGFKRVAELGFVPVKVGAHELPFTSYVFAGGQRLYHVFFCLIDDRAALLPAQAATAAARHQEGLQRAQRLRAVWEGRRHRGQQVLEVAMTGYADLAQAQRALAEELPRLLRSTEDEP